MANGAEPPAKVGYRRPPVEHRFRKGQSGNPKGRPRRSPTGRGHREGGVGGLRADDVLLDEAYRPVQVREGDEVKSMSALTAVYRSLATAAMKGDRFARQLLTGLVRDAEARQQAQLRELVEAIIIYKEGCYEAFRAADARGAPRPEFVPHPDDWAMDADGAPVLVGPADEAGKAAWDEVRRHVAAADEEIAASQRDAARHPKMAVFYHDEIVRLERLKRALDFMLPDEATRRRPGYRKPTIETARAYRAELARRYRPIADLSPDEQERALRDLAPAGRRTRKRLTSGGPA